MQRSSAFLVFAVFAASCAAAQISVLDLDIDEEQDKATEPLFTLPITVKGEQIECGFWEGQDPVDVAIEFGTLHSLSASQIRKLRQVLTQEVNDRLGEGASPGRAQTHVAPHDSATPKHTPPPVHSNVLGLRIAELHDSWASAQMATVNFAHSSFCQKHCTTENAGVLGVLATMISINAIWACIRYKGRKDKIKVKLERLAKEEAEMRKEQQEVFNETFTKGEIDALRGAMVSNLKGIRRREAETTAIQEGTQFKFGWPSWGNRKPIQE